MKFFLQIEPPTVTFQNKGIDVKGGKRYLYDRPETAEAKEKLKAHLSMYRPKEPITVPVRMSVIWMYPVKGKHKAGEWYINKPDIDNSTKMLGDCLQELGFISDDKNIVSYGHMAKIYSNKPGIMVKLVELDNTVDFETQLAWEE